jgi:hypothetical protein
MVISQAAGAVMSEENTKLAGLDFAEGIPNAGLPDGC